MYESVIWLLFCDSLAQQWNCKGQYVPILLEGRNRGFHYIVNPVL